jgi:heme/copper-type cytochrome/quinol oxidase subunit 2
MDTGSLPHWWDYVLFTLCMLVLIVGPVAIWLVAPRRRAK